MKITKMWKLVATCLFCYYTMSHVNAEGFYNIAHMTNNKPAVTWAMQEGANAVEVDLQFRTDGTPYEFYHGGPCDCSCMCPVGACGVSFKKSVCYLLQITSTKPCYAKTPANELLNHIASQKHMVLLMIDSKLTDDGKNMNAATLRVAARKVLQLLETEVFGKGFKGEVIVGAPYFASMPYIEEISKTNSRHRDRIHFTIEMEDLDKTKTKLDTLQNKNVVYTKGLSACAASPVTKYQSRIAAMNKHAGVFGMTYSWTYDRTDSLEKYSNYFNGIITNFPGKLAKIVRDKGIRLATISDTIPPATSSRPLMNTDNYESCDCDYDGGRSGFSGGCKIQKTAPAGYACQCYYAGAWTCYGRVVLCSDVDSAKCRHPDTSKQSCIEGRGDCLGYQ